MKKKQCSAKNMEEISEKDSYFRYSMAPEQHWKKYPIFLSKSTDTGRNKILKSKSII